MSFLMRKIVYKKPPDGILPIADNIYLLVRSYSIETLGEGKFRAYIENVVSQLHEHTPGGSYMGFNFSTDESNQSQISRILSEHKIIMKDCSRHYEGCPLLPMEALHNILKSSESWLARDQHFLLMHAEHGGWPILAFVLSALLIYLKHHSDEQKTLEMVYEQATPQLLELFSPLDPMPSQLRYLQYISRRNLGLEWPPVDRSVTLDRLIVRMIPDSDGQGGLRPMFRIYGQDPLTPDNSNSKLLFSTPKDKKTVRLYKKVDSEIVKIDICCHIKGDIVLECINTDEHLEWEEMVFRVMFNTAFIRSNILMLNRDQLDVMWRAKERFDKHFRAEILFSDMDLTTPKATSDIQTEGQYKEEEGLPVEAFSKVREYFGLLDWMGKDHTSLSSQRSSDISALQKPETDKSESPTKSKPKLGSDNFTNRSKSLYSEVKTDPSFSSKFEKPNLVTQKSIAPTKLRPTSSEIPSQHAWLAQSSLSKSRSSLDSGTEILTPKIQQPSIETSKEAPKDTPSLELSASFIASPRSINANRLESESERKTFTSAADEIQPSSSISTSNPATQVSLHPESAQPKIVPPPPPPPIASRTTISSRVPPPSANPPLTQPLHRSSLVIPSASPLSPPPPPPPLNKRSNTFPSPPPPPPPPNRPSTVLPPPPPLNRSASVAPPPPPPPPSSSSHPPVSAQPPPPPPPPFSAMKSKIPQAPVSTPPRAPGAPPPPPPPGKALGNQPSANINVHPPPPPAFKGKPLGHLKGPKIVRTQPKRVNLKPLHWSKVTRATQGSLWAETQQTMAPEINFSELETLFAVNVPDPKASSRRASLGGKPEITHLIELRRSNNCEIMLKNLKIPFSDLVNSVLSLDDSVLEIEQVESLVKFCPTKDEVEMLKNFKGDKEKLGKCEQYFMEIMKVPRFEPKVRILAFKIKFRNQVAELKVNLSIVNAVAEEVLHKAQKNYANHPLIGQCIKPRDSQSTIKVSQVAGSPGGDIPVSGSAVGFKLDSLLKLSDTRARDNKTTLMHYLCKVLAEKLPEVLDFSSDLIHLEPASKIQLKDLAEGMKEINEGLKVVENELSFSSSDGSSSAIFQQTLKQFLSLAEAEVRSLTALYSVVGRSADAMAAYFGEDPTKCPFETVISTLLRFVKSFEKAHLENLNNYEIEKRKAEKEAAEREKGNFKRTASKSR